MINAKIIENKPKCGNCENDDEIKGVRDWKQVNMNGTSYTMIYTYCYRCREDNRYLLDMSLEGETRYEVNGKITDITD